MMQAALACPSCRVALAPEGVDVRRCPGCGRAFQRVGGIWRMMAEGRADVFRDFIAQYEVVRSAEGKRVEDPRHLRALPYRDLSGARRYEWSVRARSFQAMLRSVVAPLERAFGGPRRVLDLGSGLCWLAYRLAQRGHEVAAVDLVVNDFDGLGVHARYDRAFLPVQAEFERLPFLARSADLVVYNASFHYAADYGTTLREALRVLAPGGAVVILDTPIYRDAASGVTMMREREEAFSKRYGFAGNAVPTEGFLTYRRLSSLGEELDLRWDFVEPWYGLRWWLKPYVARVRRTREPARFQVVVGRRAGEPG